MSKDSKLSRLVFLLESKGGVKVDEKIKFYTPELMLTDKKTKAEYEVSEIDTSAPDVIFTLFRFDENGNKYEISKNGKEITKEFELT